MNVPQSGIFALGTASHAYLEFDVTGKRASRDLVTAVAGLREPRTTMGGVNLVAGFRPELWQVVVPDDAPEMEGFNRDLVGADGYIMPATQHDAVLWLSGSAYDVVFDVARGAIAALGPVASVAEETSSWPYRHDRDLTCFIDGTENPSLIDAPDFAVIPAGARGAGGTILLLQKWRHDAVPLLNPGGEDYDPRLPGARGQARVHAAERRVGHRAGVGWAAHEVPLIPRLPTKGESDKWNEVHAYPGGRFSS